MLDLHAVSDSTADELPIQQSFQLLKMQKEVLEMVVSGSDYQLALDSLCLSVEKIITHATASIILFVGKKQQLKVRSAPNLPKRAVEQLNQLISSNNTGSCETVIFKCEPQYVFDTQSDIRWSELQPFVRDFNIQACWSLPIVNKANQVIGSFALSSFDNRKPNFFQETLMQTVSCLCSLILQKEQVETELQQAAHYDHLTQLPNRALFDIGLEHAIKQAERSNGDLALYYMDLDNFKQINDTLGHEQADRVLQHAARIMHESTRKGDTLARIGGDEFIMLVENYSGQDELLLIANRLINSFASNQELLALTKANYLDVTVSIGISCYPADGIEAKTLVHQADKAMYKAKSKGKNQYHFC